MALFALDISVNLYIYVKLQLLEDVFHMYHFDFVLDFVQGLIWLYCPVVGEAGGVGVHQQGGGGIEEKVQLGFLGFEDFGGFVQEREIRLSTGREGEDWGGGAAASSLPLLLLPPHPPLPHPPPPPPLVLPGSAFGGSLRKNQAQTSQVATSDIHLDSRFKPCPLMFDQWGRESRHHLPNNFFRRWSIHKTRLGVI